MSPSLLSNAVLMDTEECILMLLSSQTMCIQLTHGVEGGSLEVPADSCNNDLTAVKFLGS